MVLRASSEGVSNCVSSAGVGGRVCRRAFERRCRGEARRATYELRTSTSRPRLRPARMRQTPLTQGEKQGQGKPEEDGVIDELRGLIRHSKPRVDDPGDNLEVEEVQGHAEEQAESGFPPQASAHLARQRVIAQSEGNSIDRGEGEVGNDPDDDCRSQRELVERWSPEDRAGESAPRAEHGGPENRGSNHLRDGEEKTDEQTRAEAFGCDTT
jgi:hypothetical protein